MTTTTERNTAPTVARRDERYVEIRSGTTIAVPRAEMAAVAALLAAEVALDAFEQAEADHKRTERAVLDAAVAASASTPGTSAGDAAEAAWLCAFDTHNAAQEARGAAAAHAHRALEAARHVGAEVPPHPVDSLARFDAATRSACETIL